MNYRYDVVVIGSGPSGCVSAVCASRSGCKTAILERNDKIAKKIYASGNGHCNFLNTACDSYETIKEFCDGIGIVPVFEGDRLYPRDMSSASVVDAFAAALDKSGVEIFLSERAASVLKNEHGFVVKSDSGKIFECEKLILSCGGKAGIQFGCYGDGYKFARDLGHNIIKPIPALCGLECREDISALKGVRVNARVSLDVNGKILAEDIGEVQFNEDSISGICVMNLSRYLRLSDNKKYTLHLDLYPEYSCEELKSLFNEQIKKRGCAMRGLVPLKMHDYLHSRISPSQHNPGFMAALSKDISFEIISSRGWKDAQVTSGGVDMTELDENYQSKICRGLYISGELCDYDGPCGGFNIGHAILSGIKAGRNAGK